MTMEVRPYRGWDDLSAMQAVCSSMLLAAPGRTVAHPGDMAWWVGWPPKPPDALADQVLLWEDGGEVAGFAAFDPEGQLSVFVRPARTDTDGAIEFEDVALAWASRGDVAVQWMEFEDETAAVERWHARGFRPTEVGYLNLVRDLQDPADQGAADPRVRPVGDDDVAERAAILHAAFEATEPVAEYVADFARFRASPAYPDGWDLLLRDADGRAAACCLAWPDPISRAGTFEPVAVDPDLHRQGYGRALLLDGLHRFAEAGMTYAIIGAEVDNPGAEALYRSVGFRPDRMLRGYARD